MSVSMVSSMIMLDRCRIYSEDRNTEVSLSEPDDQVEQYIDFLEEINPLDWGNDMYLFELIENVFYRKKGSD
jgi:hypothetical protein